jgi:hypothetical protein
VAVKNIPENGYIPIFPSSKDAKPSLYVGNLSEIPSSDLILALLTRLLSE